MNKQVTKPSKALATSAAAKENLPAITDDPREIIESVLIRGDLSKMEPAQRTDYYMRVCQSVGLNPLTKPFEYIILNGKLTLYARRDCTDQLRAIHNVSVVSMDESDREGVHIVKCKVENSTGRTDISTGGVSIVGIKGEALANALMKAETKAKRRATLSICGLGFLDETEVADIPESSKQRVPSPDEPEIVVEPEPVRQIAAPTKPAGKPVVPSPDKPVAVKPAPAKAAQKAPEPAKGPVKETSTERVTPYELTPDDNSKSYPTWADRYISSITSSNSRAELKEWRTVNRNLLSKLERSTENYERVTAAEDQLDGMLPDTFVATVPAKPKTMAAEAGDQMPDPEADPEAAIKWTTEKMASFTDFEALNDWFNDVVSPQEGKFFPPDFQDILGQLRQLERKLAP